VLIVAAGSAVPAPSMVGGIQNIPFVVSNADAVSMNAIFWIEKVRYPGGTDGAYYLQLQYTQTVMLRFDNAGEVLASTAPGPGPGVTQQPERSECLTRRERGDHVSQLASYRQAAEPSPSRRTDDPP
jgi:hypothetical protein